MNHFKPKDVTEIPPHYIEVVKQLESQHELCIHGSRRKILEHTDIDTDMFWEIHRKTYSRCAKEGLKPIRIWRLRDNAYGLKMLVDKEKEKQCSLHRLEQLYASVLQDLMSDWIGESSESYPDIIRKEDVNHFDFFVKRGHNGTGSLIRGLIFWFSLQNDVMCHSEYDPCHHGEPYMWIRKSALEHVKQVLNFVYNKQ